MRLLLLHVPKTAGASLRTVALRHYAPRQNIHIRPAYGRDVRTSPSRNEREWLRTHTTKRQRQRSRLVTGHYRWGIHQHLPGDSEYAICLRAPDERIISMYRWLRQSRSKGSRMWAKGGFDSFLSSGLADISNGVTRILAGRADVASEQSQGDVTFADYELAAERLADCPIVGVFDDLPGFVSRLADRHHWGDVDLSLNYEHVSTTGEPRMDSSTFNKLERMNGFDWMLYEQAVKCAAGV